MRIVIITQEDIFYIPIFLRRFLELIKKEDIHLDAVFVLPSFNKSLFKLVKQLYYFYGFWGFLAQSFRYLFMKLLDKFRLKLYSISSITEKEKISAKYIEDINSKYFLNEIASLNVDVILSVAASQKFNKELLGIPKKYCINIHCSKLPKYRGMMPNFWAMYYDEKETGITIHTMDKEIDKGKIILQEEVVINPEDTLEKLIKKSKFRSADLAVKCLKEIKTGTAKLRKYEGESSYFTFPDKQKVKEFRKKGKRIL